MSGFIGVFLTPCKFPLEETTPFDQPLLQGSVTPHTFGLLSRIKDSRAAKGAAAAGQLDASIAARMGPRQCRVALAKDAWGEN